MVLIIVCVCVCVLIKSPLNRPIISLIHMDRPVKIWHVSDTCRPRAKCNLPETSIENQFRQSDQNPNLTRGMYDELAS
jgi:hypothetical protein